MKQNEEAHLKKIQEVQRNEQIRKSSIPIDKTNNRTNREIIKFQLIKKHQEAKIDDKKHQEVRYIEISF